MAEADGLPVSSDAIAAVLLAAAGFGFAIGYLLAQWSALGVVRRHIADLRRVRRFMHPEARGGRADEAGRRPARR
jgi:hypothetical protein